MKKSRLLNYLLLALVSLLLVACGNDEGSSSAANGDVIEMNVSNFQPSTHHYVYNVFEPWKELVEEKQKDE